MQLVALRPTVKLVILSLFIKWNGKIYVTIWLLNELVLLTCLVVLTY